MDTHEVLTQLRNALARPARKSAYSPNVTDEDIETAAWWLLQAELLGQPAFGIAMAARELERLTEVDGFEAGPPPDRSEPSPSGAHAQLIDATGVPGHVALASAVRQLSCAGRDDDAPEHGIRARVIRNVGALGILGSAARELALNGFVGLILANSFPLVAPWGGSQPALGTNPIAAAAPRREGAIVVDFSTSSLTYAELLNARDRGEPLPEPGGLEASGHPTRDPHSARALVPASLAGSLTGFVVELLTGVALGQDWDRGRSVLVVAIDPGSFGTDAHTTGESFARTWVEAGGHLPSRFDALPRTSREAPEQLLVDTSALTKFL